MIAVIQCASRKAADAGHLRTRDGRKVMFVADPVLAPPAEDFVFARPDDLSDTGESWRTVLRRYNANPDGNAHGLLPAWRLYGSPTYRKLAEHFGLDRLYILSAGWGLICAGFLTPNYDITFAATRREDHYKRRRRHDIWRDFRSLPVGTSQPILFFGGKGYVPLFCSLTAGSVGPRTVFYAGKEPTAPDCVLIRFGRPFTNWHYQCANAFVESTARLDPARVTPQQVRRE
ncbi:MAG: hypothetical protein OXJ63_00155 [Gammaproteobacteria bacterium]|nr:hypothetical protein [Gammaproteobacteria bacterium]